MTVLTFPLSLDDFALTLPIASFAWKLNDQAEFSGQGSGNMIGVDLAPPYWSSKVALDTMPHQQAAEIQAMIEALRPLNTFYFHDPRRPWPAYDPKGTILTGSGLTPKIKELSTADYKTLKLKALPIGYQIRRGDWLSFDFASSPVHRAYHRVVTALTVADGSGFTDWIEVTPFLQPGAAVDATVTLINAAPKCIILPRSFNEGSPKGTNNYGMAFEIRQVL